LDRITKLVLVFTLVLVSLLLVLDFNNLYDSVSNYVQNISVNDYSIIQHPIILFILAPIALLILFRTDHEKFSYLSFQKILSGLVVVILVSMVFVTPFGVSSFYWSAAFAADSSANPTDSTVDPPSSDPTPTVDGATAESSTSLFTQQTSSTGDPPSSDPTPTNDGAAAESTTSSNTNSKSTDPDNSNIYLQTWDLDKNPDYKEITDILTIVDPQSLDWIKNIAAWWSQGLISDSEFIEAIEFLINEGVITVSATTSESSSLEEIPEWVKQTVGWWAEGITSDQEFLSAIAFLVDNGIIQVVI